MKTQRDYNKVNIAGLWAIVLLAIIICLASCGTSKLLVDNTRYNNCHYYCIETHHDVWYHK